MSAGPVALCRNCAHGEWVMSKNGKNIRRQTAGKCAKQKEVTRAALEMTQFPCITMLAITAAIWPTSKAHKCPAYTPKVRP